MVWLRIVVAVLALGALAVAAVPLAVIIDLSSGGTGYGLCPGGLGACELGYGRALELSVYLVLGLFLFVALVRLAVKAYDASRRLNVRR
ncbi:MAG: hypothetical protein AB1Z57_01945 [Acidimicrobiia bacterium]